MALATKEIVGNQVRIPEPKTGEVSVISRYGKERAVLVHPDDFHRLNQLDQLLEQVSDLGDFEPSAEALRAHVEEGTPGEPVTDPAVLAELFD
jgi:hypothetical protein